MNIFQIYHDKNLIPNFVGTHIEKMNKYDQYLIPPLIIQPFTYMHIIDIDEARQTMEYYLFQ